MKCVAINTVSAALLAGFLGIAPAFAADSPNPFDHIDVDAAGFDEYQVVISGLDASGAQILLIERTFLGRLRIVSELNGKVREIVFSPNTGEIRRDIILGDYNPDDFPGASNGNGKAFGKGSNSSSRADGKGSGKAKGR